MKAISIFLVAFFTMLSVRAEEGVMTISSPAFENGKPIPAKHAYKGQNISPELKFDNVPSNARSLVLIVDDPDAHEGPWAHWLLWNISAQTLRIGEGETPSGAVVGKNSFGNAHYDGPAPPSGTHHYHFCLYALDRQLELAPGSSRDLVLEALNTAKILAVAELVGTYSSKAGAD